MAEAHEKLAASLASLRQLQLAGRRVFRSSEFSRVHRERLVKHGFLQNVMKGWLISSSPTARTGDSTSWYASFWEFCGAYCTARFNDGWHLAPNHSLMLHAGATSIPTQVLIMAETGSNNLTGLPFDTALLDIRTERPNDDDVVELNGLRVLSVPAALIRVPASFFQTNPVEAQIALARVRDTSDVLRPLLNGGHQRPAGRIAGALRRVGRHGDADEILATMRAADIDVRETDPFDRQQNVYAITATVPPIVQRLHALWSTHRDTVINRFPQAPGLPKDHGAYLADVDENYGSDAYHSLSIEGYTVNLELIERVRSGHWNPDQDDADRRSVDALAARGYWQAFQSVRATVARLVSGDDPGALVRTAHREWYREMFLPHVAAGVLKASDLAGYRAHAVYLRGSRHVPARSDVVRDAMPALFDLLAAESDPGVRAVLGSWLVGYIHPYPDGNGRISRFLMNAMLASGGFPWTVIRVEDRDAYLAALEAASVDTDLAPFTDFVATRVEQARPAWHP